MNKFNHIPFYIYRDTFLIIIGAVFSSFTAVSQVQFSAAGSYLKGSGYYDNHAYLLGGGFSMKYVFKDQFLLGATGRMYQANTTAFEHFNASDKEQNVTGTFEVIFNRKKPVKPYVGVDAGVSQTSHMINYIRANDNSFVVGLKAGSYFSFGQSTGLFMQLQYNYIDGDGKPFIVPGVENTVLTEPICKYWTFDVGLYIRLYVKTK